VNIINEKQYEAICKACDYILTSSKVTFECTAIPWLHVNREHPEYISKHIEVLLCKSKFKMFFMVLVKICKIILTWGSQFVRAILSKGKPWVSSTEMPKSVDVLYISHLISLDHCGSEADFYFGKQANELEFNNRPAVIALINHVGSVNLEVEVNKWADSSVPRVIFTNTLNLISEFKIFIRLLSESLRLRKKAKHESNKTNCKFLKYASYEALLGASRDTLRISAQVEKLVCYLNPKKIIVTYEGMAWERVVFSSARSVNPNIECIGYQFGALLRLQHSIRRNLDRKYNPDRIFTSGKISKSQLQISPGLNGIPFFVLGSTKSIKKNSNVFSGIVNETQVRSKEKKCCLVLPEGFYNESNFLCEFSLDCAIKLPDINFIWRLHPACNFKLLLSGNSKFKKLPKNIIVSQNTLIQDIESSTWGLYRGTTAIIEAVMLGLEIIYLEKKGELIIDPLYELEGIREKVNSFHEFQNIIMSGGAKNSNKKLINDYCNELFVPIKKSSILRLI
jgi:hypothetical protein